MRTFTAMLGILTTLCIGLAAVAQEKLGAAAPAAAATKPLVLLAGATGNNGSHILQQLQDMPGAPYRVRAMTRDMSKAKAKFGAAVEWVEADVTKPETLKAAFDGVDYVIDAKAAPMNPFGDTPEAINFQGTLNMIAAAKAVGSVKKYVAITSSSAGVKDHFLNTIGRDVLIYMGLAEEALIASEIPYVFIGPARLNDDLSGKAVILMPRANYVTGMTVTRADMAAVSIAALANPEANNRAFTVANGEGANGDDWQRAFARMPDN